MNTQDKNTKSKFLRNTVISVISIIGLFTLIILQSCLGGNSNSEEKQNEPVSSSKPTEEVLNRYKNQTKFTDPGEFAHMLDSLPESFEQICGIIKKQLIHPMEAAEMPELFPKDKLPEDGEYPIVAEMLRELYKRNHSGLTMDRLPEDRLLVACYHHGLLLASILRHQGKSVRLRAGFARYYEEQVGVRFSHVICEVWNADKEHWEIIDPDRNLQNVSKEKFEFPSNVWNNYRNDNLPKTKYIGSIGQSENLYIHSLLLDMTFVLRNERSYWHTPEFIFKNDFNIHNLSKEQISVLNQIAELMNDPENNLAQLEKLYNEYSFLQSKERDIDNFYE
jgi:hypothetical protein